MLPILFAIAAFFMKISDDIVDNGVNKAKFLVLISGVIYGAIFGYLLTKSEHSAYVVASIVIGCVLAGKVDSTPHYVALAIIIFCAVVFDVPRIDPMLLAAFSLTSFMDEYEANFRNNVLNKMFEYRFFLKISFLLYFLIFGVYEPLVYIIIFDSSYYITQAYASRTLLRFYKSTC